MAVGKYSDFKGYQDYINGRFVELLAQQANVFNAASNGGLRMVTAGRRGDYMYESLFSNISSSVSRRDLTSTNAATDLAISQNEHITVKLNRKFGPVAQTRDAFRKISGAGSFSMAEFSDVCAEQLANAAAIEMCDTALLGTRAALKDQSASYYTESSLGSISTQTLINALKKMGDRADRVVCWVMHSKTYYDLTLSQIGANITGISNLNVATATPVTCNRPVIITDSASLKTQLNSPDVDNYFTLGLVAGGADIEVTEDTDVVIQDITGTENLSVRYQAEWAYNLGVRGFKWDVGNGLTNPTAATITTSGNWDTNLTDVKDRAGVVAMTL